MFELATSLYLSFDQSRMLQDVSNIHDWSPSQLRPMCTHVHPTDAYGLETVVFPWPDKGWIPTRIDSTRIQWCRRMLPFLDSYIGTQLSCNIQEQIEQKSSMSNARQYKKGETD